MAKFTTHTVKIRNTHGDLATLTIKVTENQDPCEVAVEEFLDANPEHEDATLFASEVV